MTADISKRTQNHRCQRSTILSGTRQNPTLVNNLTKIGLLSPRTPAIETTGPLFAGLKKYWISPIRQSEI